MLWKSSTVQTQRKSGKNTLVQWQNFGKDSGKYIGFIRLTQMTWNHSKMKWNGRAASVSLVRISTSRTPTDSRCPWRSVSAPLALSYLFATPSLNQTLSQLNKCIYIKRPWLTRLYPWIMYCILFLTSIFTRSRVSNVRGLKRIWNLD